MRAFVLEQGELKFSDNKTRRFREMQIAKILELLIKKEAQRLIAQSCDYGRGN